MGSFDDLAKELSDPRTADKIGSYAVSCIQNNIEQGKFAANAPLTKAVKRGSHPLRDNQSLVSSISYRKTSSSVIVGTNHKGARINNYGGTITAKKGWLLIPVSSHTRTLQRRYGYSPKEVCDGLRSSGFSVWRQGRALFYREKGAGSSKKKATMIYILKKSVTIPKREFFTLSSGEIDVILDMVRGKK